MCDVVIAVERFGFDLGMRVGADVCYLFADATHAVASHDGWDSSGQKIALGGAFKVSE